MKVIRTTIISAALLVINGCSDRAGREAEIEAARRAAIDSVNAITQRERMIDSMNRVSIEQSPITVFPPDEPKPASRKSTPPRDKTGRPGKSDETVKTPDNETGRSPEAGAPTATVSQPETPDTPGGTETAGTGTANTGDNKGAEPEKKKGVSNTVKGAVIGAGAGAVGGAVINKKNPGKGAVIGGVIGAGAGAATGIILDRKKKAKDTAATKSTTKDPGTDN